MVPFNQFLELALAHDSVREIEPGKFDLLWSKYFQFIYKPVVQGSVIFKFEGAKGVGNPFDGIRLAMGKIIHGIDTPVFTRPVMDSM